MSENKLKSIRVLKGITQKQLASTLNITPQYLSRIEAGKVDIKVSMLKQIAKALEVSIFELLEN